MASTAAITGQLLGHARLPERPVAILGDAQGAVGVGPAGNGGEVGARAEDAAGAGEDGHPQVRISVEVAEGLRQGARRRAIDSIANFGSVQGDDQRRLFSNDFDFSHRVRFYGPGAAKP